MRLLRPPSLVAVLAALPGCHAASPASGAAPSGVASSRVIPFELRNPDPAARQRGDSTEFIRGQVEFGPGRQVRVLVLERLLSANDPLDSIKVGFGYGEFDAGWKEQAKSASQRIGRLSASASDTVRDTLRFTFRGPESAAYANNRLFAELWGHPTLAVSPKPVNAFYDLMTPLGAFSALAAH